MPPLTPAAGQPVQNPTSIAFEEKQAGLARSHAAELSTDVELPSRADKAPLLRHSSNPAYESPIRHHRRNASKPRHVKESLNAHSEYITSQDDGVAQHRINQYIIKQEIGRGSFGAVHLAVDQYGQEYAVKEFSKARLRKRAQSHILRRPTGEFPVERRPGQIAARQGFNSPLHRREPSEKRGEDDAASSAINLIKEEIAIMKKLDHPNLVTLIEVLDDPTEDSLYMVMEMCKKGVVMKVGLDERADPYSNEKCRCWFRDLILGIEYLHAQGIVHRDIKPDNCLITDDDVLKVVDFGVSEMFEKDSEMMTAKSAGSPAFLPPELCVAKHGDISGKAADIWSMGVTLYCLKYGRIPFERAGIFELYESIRNDEAVIEDESDRHFQDLMTKILQKDPTKRIKMRELRDHPWVTLKGVDPLLSEADNTSELVEPPTEVEMAHAITGNMTNLMTVLKAVNKFKGLVAQNRPPIMTTILGEDESSRFSQPPLAIQRDMPGPPRLEQRSHSLDVHDRRPLEGALVAEGIHREIDLSLQGDGQLALRKEQRSAAIGDAVTGSHPQRSSDQSDSRTPPTLDTEVSTEPGSASSTFSPASETPTAEPEKFPPFRSNRMRAATVDDSGHKGHAHDPLEDHLYLFIGPSTFAAPSSTADRRPSFMPDDDDVPIVSESPGAADIDIYETAYRDEIERIRLRAKEDDQEPAVYLTRRVDAKLLEMSGRAGRLMARGEEGLEKFNYVTNWRERKARVGEVSRALKAAAKDEYLRKKQEKRHEMQTAKAEPGNSKEKRPELSPKAVDQPAMANESGEQRADDDPEKLSKSASFRNVLANKSVEGGRQAKSSFIGLMSAMKERKKGSKTGEVSD